jgi:hypothetical protein
VDNLNFFLAVNKQYILIIVKGPYPDLFRLVNTNFNMSALSKVVAFAVWVTLIIALSSARPLSTPISQGGPRSKPIASAEDMLDSSFHRSKPIDAEDYIFSTDATTVLKNVSKVFL